MNKANYHFGTWEVHPASNAIVSAGARCQLEPRAMEVLVALCERAGSVVSADDLLALCWDNRASGDNPLHKTITQLRRLLGDSATAPSYIETIRKRGYRTIAPVTFGFQPARWLDESPFRGLESFDARHAPVFFGRAAATERLLQCVLEQAGNGPALVLVLGPSGSGKTSLVRAGLLPRLAQGGCAGMTLACHTALDLGEPGEGQLFTELGGAMLDWQVGPAPLFPGHSAHSLGLALAADPAALAARLEGALAAAAAPAGARLALFLDRFEAVFALPFVNEAERNSLVRALEALAASPSLLLIVACRNDFYPRITEYPALLHGKSGCAQFDLTPPSAAEIAQMIRLPALAAELSFGVDPQSQARLDDVLCQSVMASPDALPLLQYTLQELYRQRSPGGELRYEVFSSLAGVEGAIGRRAEDVLGALSEAQRAALPRVLSLVVALSPSSDAVTGRRAPWSALSSAAEREVVTALVEARLLVSDLVGNEAGFGVAHEALLRRWPRATDWIAAHRNSLRIRSRIGALAERWAGEGRPADLLIPAGKQLEEARDMLDGGALSLAPLDSELIRASSRKARLRERLRLGAAGLILALAVLTTGLGVTAVDAKRVAEQRRADAESLVEFMLGDFAEKLRPLARLDLLDSISARALAYLTPRGGAGQDATGVLQRVKALHLIGEVRVARGDPRGASAAFAPATAMLLAQLALRPGDPEVLKTLGANAFWLGQIALDRNDLASAAASFQLYRDYSDRLHAADPAKVDTWIEQSYAHNNLGTLAMRRGDVDGAAREFALSISLKTRALARKPQDRSLSAELADSLSWLADTNQSQGRLANALALYQRELRLVDALHKDAPDDAVWADRRARALQHCAGVLLALGRAAEALRDYALAGRLIGKNLELEPGNQVWQRSMAFVQMEQQRLNVGLAAPAAVLAALDDPARRLGTLTRLDPANTDWVRLEAVLRQRRAALLIELGHADAAGEALGQSRAALERLLARDQADGRTRISLAHALLQGARLRLAQRDRAGALAACGQARALLREQARNSGDYKVLDPWVRAHACLGQAEDAHPAIARLSDMGYREAEYALYLSTFEREHQP